MDLAILGGMQVAANGDLANWQVPNKKVTGMGGAMDLVSGARRRGGDDPCESKRRRQALSTCSFPLTGMRCVDRVITDLGVFEPRGDHFAIVELAEGVAASDVEAVTGAVALSVGALRCCPPHAFWTHSRCLGGESSHAPKSCESNDRFVGVATRLPDSAQERAGAAGRRRG